MTTVIKHITCSATRTPLCLWEPNQRCIPASATALYVKDENSHCVNTQTFCYTTNLHFKNYWSVVKHQQKELRVALFWGTTQRIVEIHYRRFGTTYRSRLQGSRNPRKKPVTLASGLYRERCGQQFVFSKGNTSQ